MKTVEPKEGDLRVWWIPQVPGKAFHVYVETPEEGAKVMDVLAQYDLFQFDNRIKPDYCNAGGLTIYEDDGDGGLDWSDWYDEQTGMDLDEWMEARRENEDTATNESATA